MKPALGSNLQHSVVVQTDSKMHVDLIYLTCVDAPIPQTKEDFELPEYLKEFDSETYMSSTRARTDIYSCR